MLNSFETNKVPHIKTCTWIRFQKFTYLTNSRFILGLFLPLKYIQIYAHKHPNKHWFSQSHVSFMRVFISWAMEAISFLGSISYLHAWKLISTLSLLWIFKQGSTITSCGLTVVYGIEILFIYSYYCWGVGNFISRHLKNQWHALWGLLKDWCCEINLVIKRDCTPSSHCVHHVGFCVADDFEKMAYSFLSHAWEQKRIHDPGKIPTH